LARRVAIPYPLLLVIGGLLLSHMSNLPRVQIDPDYVFLVFLPPLLYYAALQTSWRDFCQNIRPISLLAVGLTLFTTVAVAAAAHWTIPNFSWPVAFVLGAIISPPDAIAATAVAQRLRVPKRIITILEGESLVNDAIALVAYRFAVQAAGSGGFSMSDAAVQFVIVSSGGIVVGLAVGFLVTWIRPRLHDPSVEEMVSLLTPYLAYLPAERLHLSGVLATVACGLMVARRISHIASPTMRIRGYAVWDAITFLLNGLVFILIGFALPGILDGIQGIPRWQLIEYAVMISATAVIVRLIWVYPATYLPRMLIPYVKKHDPIPSPGGVFVVGWTGMRGIVSLAAALALPRVLPDGAAFPNRAMVLFLTFGVIVSTLLVQGLSLPLIIRVLKLKDAENAERDEEVAARYLTALAAVERLDGLVKELAAPPDIVGRVRHEYDQHLAYYSGRLVDDETEVGVMCDTDEQVRREALQAERKMLVKLRDDGVIGDDILRRVERELDLEESRFDGV
jgi:CPA1 family monovalent cation:H+ antiporter